MHHEYIDRYSRQDSMLHRIDPRIKLAFALAIVFTISFSSFWAAILILVLVLTGMLISGVPMAFYFRKAMFCFPFLVFLLFLPPQNAILLFTRAMTSIFCMMLFVSTTRFTDILGAMRFYRVPKLFILMLSFFYRYIFLFMQTIHQMKLARDSRSFSRKQRLGVGTASNMVGSLLVRSFEQSERVYSSMLARGYDDTD